MPDTTTDTTTGSTPAGHPAGNLPGAVSGAVQVAVTGAVTAGTTGAGAPGTRRAAVLPWLLGPWPLAAVAAAGVAVVAVVDPNEPGHYPLCPFYALTGLYCPGCGALRATHALAHGDVGTALGLNPLYVLALPWLAALWLLWVRRRATGRVRMRVAPAWLVWGFLVTEVLFTVARNLPWFTVLAP